MSKFVIEKNIPLAQRKSPYPFADMVPGDSFLIPESGWDAVKKVSGHIQYFMKSRNPNHKFAVRSTKQNGTRVWCIAKK